LTCIEDIEKIEGPFFRNTFYTDISYCDNDVFDVPETWLYDLKYLKYLGWTDI